MAEYSDTSIANLLARIDKLQSRLERLERAPRAGNTAIDTGEFTVKDPVTGNVILRVGQQEHGDTGVSIYREDGTLALQIAKPFSPADEQAMRMLNKSEEIIGGDNILAVTGTALYNNITPTKTSDTGVAVTSGTFVDIYDIDGPYISPAHTLVFSAICSDGSTAGEVRVVNKDTGTSLTGFFVTIDPEEIPAGTTTLTDFTILGGTSGISQYYVTRNMGETIRHSVQARRTAGAGTVTVKARYYKQTPF
jgi:hypothetical protein